MLRRTCAASEAVEPVAMISSMTTTRSPASGMRPGRSEPAAILPAGGSVLLHKYPTLVHTACIAQPEELADTDTPAALAQLEALVREKG